MMRKEKMGGKGSGRSNVLQPECDSFIGECLEGSCTGVWVTRVAEFLSGSKAIGGLAPSTVGPTSPAVLALSVAALRADGNLARGHSLYQFTSRSGPFLEVQGATGEFDVFLLAASYDQKSAVSPIGEGLKFQGGRVAAVGEEYGSVVLQELEWCEVDRSCLLVNNYHRDRRGTKSPSRNSVPPSKVRHLLGSLANSGGVFSHERVAQHRSGRSSVEAFRRGVRLRPRQWGGTDPFGNQKPSCYQNDALMHQLYRATY